QSGEVFFSLHIRLGIQPPKLNNLGQYLIDGESVKAVQPFLRRIRDGRVGMLRHHISDILKHLQGKQVEAGILRVILVDALFQVPQVFEDIPVEFHPVNPWNSCGGLESDLLSVDRDRLLHAHGFPSYAFVLELKTASVFPAVTVGTDSAAFAGSACCVSGSTGSVVSGIYTEEYQPV